MGFRAVIPAGAGTCILWWGAPREKPRDVPAVLIYGKNVSLDEIKSSPASLAKVPQMFSYLLRLPLVYQDV